MKVALSIGHHPNAQGVCMANRDGLSEYEFWRQHLPRIAERVRKLGHDAWITNRGYAGGTTPSYAAMACNATRADLAVEFHFNATTGASGTETWHWPDSGRGKLAATLIQAAMVKVLELPDRGLKTVNSPSDNAYNFFKKTIMPAVLVEPAFAGTTTGDCERLAGRIDALCDAIADAIVDYFNRQEARTINA